MQNYARTFAEPFRGLQRTVIATLLLLVTVVVISWLVNCVGLLWINSIIALVSLLAIVVFAYGPAHLIQAGFLGAVYNLLNTRNPVTGAGTGLKIHTQIVIVVSLTFVAAEFILATIPFQADPTAFWYCMLGVILILLVMQFFKIPVSRLVPLCAIAFIGLMITARLWNTLGLPSFSTGTTEATKLASTLPIWVVPGLLGAIVLTAFLFLSPKKAHVIKTLMIIGAIGFGGTFAYKQYQTRQSCSEEWIKLSPGSQFTITKDCPVYGFYNINEMSDGFRFDLVDANLRERTPDNAFITTNTLQYSRESGEVRQIFRPNKKVFEEYGRTRLEFFVTNTASDVSTFSMPDGTLCSTDRIQAVPGVRIIVTPYCPVYVDQTQMSEGFTYALNDMELRRQTNDDGQEFVTHSINFLGKRFYGDIMLTPKPEAFKRFGKESLEFIVYPKGKAPVLIADNCSKDIIRAAIGTRFTVAPPCPVYVDISNLSGETDYSLADPEFASRYPWENFVTDSKYSGNIYKFSANIATFEKTGEKSVEIVIHEKGSSVPGRDTPKDSLSQLY